MLISHDTFCFKFGKSNLIIGCLSTPINEQIIKSLLSATNIAATSEVSRPNIRVDSKLKLSK